MPQAQDERVVSIEGFEGLNIREPFNAVGDKDLTEATNLDLGRGGELVKRTGFRTLTNFASTARILGFFNTDTRQEFIAAVFDGASVWRLYTSTDGVNWTDRGAFDGSPQHAVQYIDKMYIVQTGGAQGLYSWDGTLTAISGTPKGTYCRVFKDRLFVLDSNGLGVVASRIYFSRPFDFGTTGWPAVNYVSVGEGDGDRLVAAFNVQDTFLIFKTGAAWVLYVQGDQTLWILRPFNSEVGCISKHTLILFEGVLYFLSPRGVYQTDGNTVRNISTDVSPLFSNLVISTTAINQHSAFIWEDKYVLAMETFPETPTWNNWQDQTWGSLSTVTWGGAGAEYHYLVYHIRQKGWTKWALAGGLDPHVFTTLFLSPTLRGVYGTTRTSPARIVKFGEVRYQDDTNNYEIAASTKEFDFGAPTEMKRGKWIGVSLRGSGDHTFAHVVDGSTKPGIPVSINALQLEHKAKGPEYFRSWRFRIAGTHNGSVSFFGVHMHLSRRRQIAASRG